MSQLAKQLAATLLGLGLSSVAMGQSCYTGTIGPLPIELTLEDGGANQSVQQQGMYVYTKFDTPIKVSGTLKHGTLTLTERDSHGKATGTFTVAAFSASRASYTGTWKNLTTGQRLPLVLTRRFDLWASPPPAGPLELRQYASLPSIYFQEVLAKDAETGKLAVSQVRLLEKKTDRLVQQFDVECERQGLTSIMVGDYNFDGHPDFAVFEHGYAGPNTSSLYFLYNPATKRFEESGFEGISLEFDAAKKRIYERNSCCAGTSVTTAVYKLVKNEMVPLETHCYRWSEKSKRLVERPASECQ
jgi:hypothetical protein